jgi:plasmid maintenance system antidote protein VapI
MVEKSEPVHPGEVLLEEFLKGDAKHDDPNP